MARIDFTSQRLFVTTPLEAGLTLPLDRAQANYLLNVLRFQPGDALLVFDGAHGEWRAVLAASGRKAASLAVLEQVRPQPAPSPLVYCFAPLKQARLDYLVQKAVEMGAGALQPVLTQHTQVSRLNADRLRANMVEAAEQCGVLAVPELRPECRFDSWLAAWPAEVPLVFCDEEAEGTGPLDALDASFRGDAPGVSLEGDAARRGAVGVLIGPEGGFSAAERSALLALPHTVRLSLGPRILRADTAAVAALALVQATRGDWRRAQ